MTDYAKPPKLDKIWASVGDKTPAPDDAKIATGFIVEIPLIEQFNYLEWKQDAALAHINQRGIPEWDSVSEYTANKSYAQGSDGLVYKAKTTHTNVDPVGDITETNWRRAFYDTNEVYSITQSNVSFLSKASNLSDVANTTTARSNLGVYSTTETNALYLAKTSNLSDVTSAATAFNNIKQLATDTYVGASQFSTDSELSAGSVTNKSVAPSKLKLGFSINLAQIGHFKFPNWLGGLVIQWGQMTVFQDSNSLATLSIPFPTACLQAVCGLGVIGDPLNENDTPYCTPIGATLRLYNPDTNDPSLIRWIAIGY